MLDERQALVHDGTLRPTSRYLADLCEYFDYMIDLAPGSFAKLRVHTFHLIGDNYQTYYFGNRTAFSDYYGPWLATDDLPPEHVLNEPEDGIGFSLDDGRFVSADIARFQRSVSTLSRRGILAGLTKPAVIEIGGGYGGLALHLSRIFEKSHYVLIDLPETLIFSAAYLTLHACGKRLYLYDPADRLDPARLTDFDFILLPDYRLQDLADSRFDLAINIASMQEMRVDQIERYLDFLRATCRGVFYSCNRDHQIRNDELPGLFDLIRTRFDLTEVAPPRGMSSSRNANVRRILRGGVRRLAQSAGLVEPGSAGPSPDPFPFVEHLERKTQPLVGVRDRPKNRPFRGYC